MFWMLLFVPVAAALHHFAPERALLVFAASGLAIIPLAGAIASLFGYGAVLLLAWRVFRGSTSAAAPTVSGITPAPMPS